MRRLPNAVELDTRHVVELFKKYPDVRNIDFTSKPYVIGTNPKFDVELKSVIEFAAANR